MKPTVAMLIKEDLLKNVITQEEINRLQRYANVNYEYVENMDNIAANRIIKNADICMTCWGTTCLTKDILDKAPNLKLISHAAGTIKYIVSDEVWNRGIKVTNAVTANGISVAEHTLGAMLFMSKKISDFNKTVKNGGWRIEEQVKSAKALYKINIGIIGAGHIGRHVIKLLKNFEVNVLLYDPFITDEEAKQMGVTKVELEELIKNSHIVSLHAPKIPSTYHMINKDNLKLMQDGSILINTARGALIDHKALIDELKTNRITAYLDVTDPEEPPAIDSDLRKLPNLIVTPHIAGCISNDLPRMGNYAVNEVIRYITEEPLLYEIKQTDVSHIA